MTRSRFATCLAAALLAAPILTAAAQQVSAPPPASVESQFANAAAQTESEPAAPATLTYANRPVMLFRVAVLGRPPSERAAVARQVIKRIADGDTIGSIETRAVGPVMMVSIGGQDVFGIVPGDVDTLAGETLATTAAGAVSRLQTALDEVAEARRPQQLAISVLLTVVATVVFVLIAWLLIRLRATAAKRLTDAAVRRLQASKVGDGEFLRAARIVEFLQGIVTAIVWAVGLFVAYSWLVFTLRRFPYTRFWGESLRGYLVGKISVVFDAVIYALPGLFTILIIILLTRFVGRLVKLFFRAVQDERITVPWIYAETAEPTRKLVLLALWLFAVAISYPYLPGSDSEAFKGVSVFVGLMVSLGSSGLVSQMVGGLMLIYSRALRKGDFVLVGEIEGTVTQIGTLSTKIKTGRNEDVTIPNAVVISQTVTNYSRGTGHDAVYIPTDVTIGYSVAWRQVEALLLLAVARTPGVRRIPAPLVRQSALEETFVRYTLWFCLETPSQRRPMLAAVHANILDAFNEYGVQITSPRYENDPPTPKVVPRIDWYPTEELTEARRAAESHDHTP